MDFYKVKFIWNPKAGRKGMQRKIMDGLNKAFTHSALSYYIQTTQGKGDATRLAREALIQGYDLLVAMGGDGTINEESDQVMEKVDQEGNILGFSIFKVSKLREKPFEVALT